MVEGYCDLVLKGANSSTCRIPAPIPLCLSQIAYDMSFYRIWAINLFVMTQPIKLRNKSSYGCNLSCRWLSLLCWLTRTVTPSSCPASSSMIRTRVHLLAELAVMVGCVSIVGDRSSTWWSSGTLWQVINIV